MDDDEAGGDAATGHDGVREPGAGGSAVPRGRRWRRRWQDLDDDVRELIVDTVDAGEACKDPDRAALAVTYATRTLRDVLGAVLLGPALAVLAVAVGFAAGRLTRGDSAMRAFVDILTWESGVPWVAATVVLMSLAYVAARRRLRRLRAARKANRANVRP